MDICKCITESFCSTPETQYCKSATPQYKTKIKFKKCRENMSPRIKFHSILPPVLSRSVVSDSLRSLWTVPCQAPLSMGFTRQEYWNGLPISSLGDLPDPGIKPSFPALQADSLPPEPAGKPTNSRREN